MRRRSGHLHTGDYHDRLPSRDPDIDFTTRVHLTLRVLSKDVPPDPLAPAACDLRPLLTQVTEKWSVLRREAAQQEINVALRHPFRGADYEVTSALAVLTVDRESVVAAERLRHERREAHLDELARRQLKARMSFLREECFSNPGDAKLFAMLNAHPRLGAPPPLDQVRQVVDEVSEWHESALPVRLAALLQEVTTKLSPERMDELVKLLCRGLNTVGEHEASERLAEFD